MAGVDTHTYRVDLCIRLYVLVERGGGCNGVCGGGEGGTMVYVLVGRVGQWCTCWWGGWGNGVRASVFVCVCVCVCVCVHVRMLHECVCAITMYVHTHLSDM